MFRPERDRLPREILRESPLGKGLREGSKTPIRFLNIYEDDTVEGMIAWL